MANKIQITLEVDDKGSVKVKEFGSESKKTFKETEEGSQKAKGALDEFKNSWLMLVAKVAAAKAVFNEIKRVTYDFALGIASAASDIERQAAALGLSTDEFQRWQYIARMTDIESTSLTMGLRYLADQMGQAAKGTGEAAKYLKAMGISVTDTSGQLRPLMDVIEDIADKMSTWKDGTDKLNYAIQIFGQRAGQQFIGLLNEGRAGIKAWGEEAEKTGAIVRKDLIAAGSEAEETFKNLSKQWESFKLSLGPTALEIAKFLNQIRPSAETLKAIFEEINQTIANIKRLLEGLGFISPEVKTQRAYIDVKGPKITPPIIPSEKDIESIKKYAEDAYQEYLKDNEAMLTAQEWKIKEEITAEQAKYDEFLKMAQENEASVNELNQAFLKNAELRINEEIEAETKISILWETLAQNMASAWNFNIKNIIQESENLADALKNIFTGIADAFTSAISRMISNWILFGDVTGKYTKGGPGLGWTGIIGTIAGFFKEGGVVAGFRPVISIPKFQSGAVVDRPTLAMVGEGGEREWIIPESKIGKGRNQPMNVYFHINAVDAASFLELCERNPGAILKVFLDDERTAGITSRR